MSTLPENIRIGFETRLVQNKDGKMVQAACLVISNQGSQSAAPMMVDVVRGKQVVRFVNESSIPAGGAAVKEVDRAFGQPRGTLSPQDFSVKTCAPVSGSASVGQSVRPAGVRKGMSLFAKLIA